jgi:hypothetical protein
VRGRNLLTIVSFALLATVVFGAQSDAAAVADGTTTCTRVLGGSQTSNWYSTGDFETLVVNRDWERQSRGGQYISHWAVGGQGWATRVWSACGQDSIGGTPFLPVDHVVLHALPDHGTPSVADIVQVLGEAIDGIHTELPEAVDITLMPPIRDDCPGVGLADVNPTVVAAIAQVADGDILVGPDILVPDCSMFADNAGHLTLTGSQWVAEQVAAWFESGDPAPVADAGPDQVVTLAEGATTADAVLDGSGSTDNGTIVDYTWSENSTQIGTGVNPTVAFTEGDHTVTLTVTDDNNETDTDTVQITVNPPASGSMHVSDLDGSSSRVGKTWVATVTATVLSGGAPVAGATVSGTWLGGTGATSCVTDAAGQCTVGSDGQDRHVETLDFTVTDVSSAGLQYDPASNSDSDGDSDGTTITVLRPES